MMREGAEDGDGGPLDPVTRIVMLGGGAYATLAMVAVTPILPQIEAALAHDATDRMLVKQLVGVVGLAMVAGAPLAGWLADRIGVRRVLAGAAVLFTLGGTTGLYVTSLPLLLACRLLVGASGAAIQIMSFALIGARVARAARPGWIGGHTAVAMLSSLVFLPIAGALGRLDWRWPFALYGLGVVLLVLALSLRPQPAKVIQRREQVVERAGGWFPFGFLPLGFLVGAITYLPMVYVPYIARARGFADPSLIALLLMGSSVVSAAVALCYGGARTRLTSGQVFRFNFACTAAGALLVALAPGLAGIELGLMVFGLGTGWAIPNLITALSTRVAPAHQGTATGWVKAAHFLAAPTVVVLVEPLTRTQGPVSAMWLVAALSLAGCLLFSLQRSIASGADEPAPVSL